MDTQGRYGSRCNPIQGAADDVLPSFLFQISAKKEGQYFRSIDTFPIRLSQITGAIIIHYTIYCAGVVEVAASLKFWHVCSDTEKLGQMPSRGTSSCSYSF